MKKIFLMLAVLCSYFLCVGGAWADPSSSSKPFVYTDGFVVDDEDYLQWADKNYRRVAADSTEERQLVKQALNEPMRAEEKQLLSQLLSENEFVILKVANEGAQPGQPGAGQPGDEAGKEGEPDFKPVPPDPDETDPRLKDDPLGKRWNYHLKQVLSDFFSNERRRPAVQWILGGLDVVIIVRVTWLAVTGQLAEKSLILRALGLNSTTARGAAAAKSRPWLIRMIPVAVAAVLGVDLAARIYIWRHVERDPGFVPLITIMIKGVQRANNPPEEKYPDRPRDEDDTVALPLTHM